jgi:hypothetical protein
MKTAATWLLAIAPFTASCLATGEGDDDGEGAFSISVSAADTALVLDLVNYPGVTVELLDGEAGIEARAATTIIGHRDGGDNVPLTGDDDPYDSLAELDAIRFVGDATLRKLIAFAHAHAVPASQTVETVAFTGWQAEAVTWGVAHATFAELDVGMDARAARGLVDRAGTLATLDAIAAVPYVGPSVLTWLRGQAPTWWTKMQPPVTPTGCEITVAPRGDGDAEALTQLLALATMGDWPMAEVVALQAPACFDYNDTNQRALLTVALVTTRAINWGYSPFVSPAVVVPFQPGGHLFVGSIEEYQFEITDRVDSERWTPANADEQGLYDNMSLFVNHLTAGPHDNQSDYVQLRLWIDAEECSQDASVMMQLSTKRIWVAHDNPRC